MPVRLSTKIVNFLRSKKCFWLIVGMFVVESGWIAISSSYPMAFDEDFHFGIIKLYAQQWSPFFSHQPAGGNAFGALTSDPSYLFHYLMSFPYRLTTLVTHSLPVQIVTLRFIDIALVAWSLVLFRAILLKTKASSALVNTALLFFILIPVVPLLAGQINYDDLLLPLGALAILTSLQLRERLLAGQLPVGLVLKLAATCMLASLVQFEFLPIFAAIASYVIYRVWRLKKLPSDYKSLLRKSWQFTSRLSRFAYLAIFLVALGLFGSRYGTNLVAYKTPVPQCNQVLTIAQCSAYVPWERNYTDELKKVSVSVNPVGYSANWFRGMFEHSFFTSSSGSDTAAFYVHAPPLPIISVAAIIVFAGGLGLFLYDIFHGNTILRRYQPLGFLLFVSLSYCIALCAWNYHDFVHLGAAVALNGRYLFPVLPPILLAIGLAYQSRLRQRMTLRVGLLVLVLGLFLEGGGALTFIDASNAHWYWDNSVPRTMNAAVQRIVKPLILS